MKYMIINTFFGWLCKAPLLYTATDWILAICEIILIYICVNTLIHKNGYKYFVNFTHGQADNFGIGYLTYYKKIKNDRDIQELTKQIEKNNCLQNVKIINFTKI